MSNSQATAVMGGSRLKSAKEYKYALTDEARELIWDLRDASRAYGDQPCAQNQKLIDAAVAALRSYIVELSRTTRYGYNRRGRLIRRTNEGSLRWE